MSIIEYLLLAFIQAATEFLPVSSSGHLLFFKGILDASEVPVIYDIIIHVGSLAAIIIFYFNSLKKVAVVSINEISKKSSSKPNCKFVIYIIISSAITFFFYKLFNEPIESNYNSPSILRWTFLITTCLLVFTRFFGQAGNKQIHQQKWFFPIYAGIMQALAILPGVSRSGATISTMLYFKTVKKQAAFYSFTLAIPAILGAFIFKLFELDSIDFIRANWIEMILSFIVSLVFSYLFLKLLTLLLEKGRFWYFGIYTFVLAVLSWILF